jgi:hypothetical protein
VPAPILRRLLVQPARHCEQRQKIENEICELSTKIHEGKHGGSDLTQADTEYRVCSYSFELALD